MTYIYDPADDLRGFYAGRVNALNKRIGHDGFSADIDRLVRELVIGLWHCGQKLSEDHVLAINAIYSRGQPRPTYLYWELVSAVSAFSGVAVPEFYRVLASLDHTLGMTVCRELTALVREVLGRLSDPAAPNDREARYSAAVVRALSAILNGGDGAQMTVLVGPPPAAEPSASGSSPQTEAETDAAPEAETEKEDLEALLAELDALVGLDSIKQEVRSLINLVKVRKLREENGLTVPQMSLHMVFTGNPGTGKTTVARLISRLFHSIGVLSTGTLVEVDRSGLVAGYVGQTALKTTEAVEKAKGGVLFIDEAYALAPEGAGNDYGREAIEVILKSMEDNRGDLVVIAAGYTEPMERFISSNPGLESRFGKYFEFPDYDGEELYAIFESMCRRNMYEPDEEATAFAKTLFQNMYDTRDQNFGNARDVRNIFERAVARQSDRVAALEAPSREALMQLQKCDIAV